MYAFYIDKMHKCIVIIHYKNSVDPQFVECASILKRHIQNRIKGRLKGL